MIMRSLDHFVCTWDIRCTVFGVYSRWLDFFLGVFTLLKFCRDLSIFHLVWYSRCIFLGSKSEMDGLSQKFS